MSDGDRSRQIESIAAQAAAADLRAGFGSDAEASGFAPDIFEQIEGLEKWAERAGRVLEPEYWVAAAGRGGMEHDLWFDSQGQRYIKITHAGFFGRYPALDSGGSLSLRPGTVLEYLDRLALSSELFGDDQRVLGVVGRGKACRLVTEQGLVVGMRPSREEINAYMDALDFSWVASTKAYFRSSDGVAVFDVHGGNYLCGEGGQVFAIDVIPVRVGARLAAYFWSL